MACVENNGSFTQMESQMKMDQAGIMLLSPEGHKIHCTLRFGFQASNDEVEYKALVARLKLAKELKVDNLKVYNDSQLVVNHVNETYQVRRERMVAYLKKGKELLGSISALPQRLCQGQIIEMPMHWPGQLPLRMMNYSMQCLQSSYLSPASNNDMR